MNEKDQIRAHLKDSADAGIAVLRITHGQHIDVKPFNDALAAEVIDELFQIGSPALVASEIARIRAAAPTGSSKFGAALKEMVVTLKIAA